MIEKSVADSEPVVAEIDSTESNLQNRWDDVLSKREPLATELNSLSEILIGEERKLAENWSNWFGSENQLEQVLRRPDILAIVLPWLQQTTNQLPAESSTNSTIELSPAQVAARAMRVFDYTKSIQRRLWQSIRYPMLIVFGLGAMWLIFSIGFARLARTEVLEYTAARSWISDAPELPFLSRLVLGDIPHLHVASWIFFAVLAIVSVFWLWSMRSGRHGLPGDSLFDRRLTSTRHATGKWAWHVALLLRCGVDDEKAKGIASDVCQNAWLKNRTQIWQHSLQVNPDQQPDVKEIFADSPFTLVHGALRRKHPEQKALLLEQAAAYYMERDRVITSWWFRIISWLILWNLLAAGGILLIGFYQIWLSLMKSMYWFW